MPPRRGAQIDARPLDDAPFGEERLYPREIAPVTKQCSEQPWLVSGGRHGDIILHLCIYVSTSLVMAQGIQDDDDQHDREDCETYPDRQGGQIDSGVADRCLY